MSQTTSDKVDLLRIQKQDLIELIDQLEEAVKIGDFETLDGRKYAKLQLRECKKEVKRVEKKIEKLLTNKSQ